MKQVTILWVLLGLALSGGNAVFAAAQSSKGKGKRMTGAQGELKELETKLARLTPVELNADLTKLSSGDRKALDKIVEAARLMDPLYLRQVWSGNVALEKKLEADSSPLGRLRLRWFQVNAGPWSRLDKNEPFLAGVPKEKPPQAAFYPDDMTKAEFEAWEKTLSEADKKKATGYFYAIRRGADRKLEAVPYSDAYREFLEPASKRLKEAAELTDNASLKRYLKTRADAFLSNDYFESDVAWMDLDAPIEPTIGPYETYEDEMFGYKATFEAFVTLRDDQETAKLAKFSSRLQEIENNLPIEDRYKNPKLGAMAPIRVVDEVFTSGEANRGVQTAAFNLPNDERVVKEKGTKRVMLKNVQEAKFHKVLEPIAKLVLEPGELKDVQFDPFFTHILMHELMHGLGPHNIKVGGKETTPRLELKELYSAIEEAKADITGLFAMQYLIDKGGLDKSLERTMYTTFLASAFRSVRFGLNEAHGKGIALQFNYLLDEGAFREEPAKGTFRVDPARVKDAVKKLTHDLLTLEAEGDYARAKAMLDKYAVLRPGMKRALDKMAHVPIDISPRFPLASGPHAGR